VAAAERVPAAAAAAGMRCNSGIIARRAAALRSQPADQPHASATGTGGFRAHCRRRVAAWRSNAEWSCGGHPPSRHPSRDAKPTQQQHQAQQRQQLPTAISACGVAAQHAPPAAQMERIEHWGAPATAGINTLAGPPPHTACCLPPRLRRFTGCS
jgi:hypothetical protein